MKIEPRPCKSCQAPIFYALTEKGRMIPLDAKPEQRFLVDGELHARAVNAYQTHFATCPNADAHRKPKEGANGANG